MNHYAGGNLAEALARTIPHSTKHLILTRLASEGKHTDEVVKEEYPLDHYLSMELEDIIAELAEQTHIHLVKGSESLFDIIENLAAMTRLAAGLMVIEFSYKKRAYLALADSIVIGAKMVDGYRILYGKKVLNELEKARGPTTIILYLTSTLQV